MNELAFSPFDASRMLVLKSVKVFRSKVKRSEMVTKDLEKSLKRTGAKFFLDFYYVRAAEVTM